jgi:voltage-gated anion channel
MATGIVSNALFLQGPRRLSDLMFVANAVAYVWLAGLTIVRAARFPGVVWSDLLNPRLVFAFFSFVAATDVLGEGGYLRGFATTALYLWLLALFVWFVLIYVGFAVLPFLIPPARPTSFTADGCWRLSALNLWWFWALRSRR